MKKYIKPAINVHGIIVENLLAASPEGGQQPEGKAKGNSNLWIEDDEPTSTENASW